MSLSLPQDDLYIAPKPCLSFQRLERYVSVCVYIKNVVPRLGSLLEGRVFSDWMVLWHNLECRCTKHAIGEILKIPSTIKNGGLRPHHQEGISSFNPPKQTCLQVIPGSYVEGA